MNERLARFWEQYHENVFALSMLVLASFLAINDLVAGRYGDDEIMMTADKSNQFQWYQSKSIKEYVVKGQADLLDTLMKSGIIKKQDLPEFEKQHKKLSDNVDRYKKEKNEILLGSKTVGQENWVQDFDGKMGQIIGVKEYDKELRRYAAAGDKWDIASLFFQISLMLGALGIMMKKLDMKKYALLFSLGMGIIGVFYSAKGLFLVL